MAVDLQAIPILAELDRAGIRWEQNGEEEIKCLCPFHEDKSKDSCNVNVKSGLFRCFVAGCHAAGNFLQYMARYGQTTLQVYLQQLEDIYGITSDKTIAAETIERYHAGIFEAHTLRQELYKRGLTDAMIRRFRLGESEGRITIPIPNEGGLYVNVRKYLPGAPGKQKMRNAKGHGEVRIFPPLQVRDFEVVMLCGGECKAIVALDELNPHGIGAACFTCGEDNATPALLQKFKGKKVYICGDIDEPGIKAAKLLAQQMLTVTNEVYLVHLPLDPDKFPKGDINDYKAQGGKLFPLLASAVKVEKEAFNRNVLPLEEPKSTILHRAYNSEFAAKRVKTAGAVSSMDTAPYFVPREFKILCSQDKAYCALCPVFLRQQDHFEITAESASIIEFVGTGNDSQMPIFKRAIGIPAACNACHADTHSFYNVQDVKIGPAFDINSRDTDSRNFPALVISEKDVVLNDGYDFTGRVWPHPKTQQAILLVSEAEQKEDSLANFSLDEPGQLGVFWPKEWTLEAVDEKIKHIYGDLAANVTRIFERPDLHFATDLVYHSPLFMRFDGEIHKAWTEAIIIGDSALGKSFTSQRLQNHYGLGVKVDSKTLSVAGLIGGLEAGTSGRYFVKWGVLVQNDRRLVLFEELKGAPEGVWSKATETRTSGRAELTKIEHRIAPARCRVLCNTNTLTGIKMSRFNFGVEALKEVVPALEDIRRFDFAFFVGADDIPADVINRLEKDRPIVDAVHTAELCRLLVLWTWTRTADQVQFTDEATALILQEATRFSSMFSEQIPLLDRGSTRLKLARLSAACAARLFSCSEDFQSIVIYPAHVQYVVRYLETHYSGKTSGFLAYSKALRANEELRNPEDIIAKIACMNDPNGFVRHILAQNVFDVEDMCNWMQCERLEAEQLKTMLAGNGALNRAGKGAIYRKSAPFITMLRDFEQKPFPSKDETRPNHVERPRDSF